jgi:multicomponent Na+:H+ antiporter subunit D
LKLVGALFVLGGLVISSLPLSGAFLGKSMIEDAAIKAGYGFVPPVIVLVSALAGAAVLRAGARVFAGWGDVDEEQRDAADEDTVRETSGDAGRTPAVMILGCALLAAGAIACGIWFGFAELAQQAAVRFTSGHAYRAIVFGARVAPIHAASSSPEWYDWLYCGGATALAIALAALGLWGRRLGADRLLASTSALLAPVRRLHTGRIGDYTAALTLGVGVLGALFALTLR